MYNLGKIHDALQLTPCLQRQVTVTPQNAKELIVFMHYNYAVYKDKPLSEILLSFLNLNPTQEFLLNLLIWNREVVLPIDSYFSDIKELEKIKLVKLVALDDGKHHKISRPADLIY